MREDRRGSTQEKSGKAVAVLLCFLRKRGGGVAKWRRLSMWILSGQAGVLYGKCHGSGALPSIGIPVDGAFGRSGAVVPRVRGGCTSGRLPVEKDFNRRNRRGLCDATHGVSDCGAERCLNWYAVHQSEEKSG